MQTRRHRLYNPWPFPIEVGKGFGHTHKDLKGHIRVHVDILESAPYGGYSEWGSGVVYGSRVLNKKRYKNNFISNYRILGNHLLTMFSNLINKQKLTDAHSCYKLFSADLFKNIKLEHNDFSFCPEITTKISNLKKNIIEVPISYRGRSIEEGKKIRLKDAFYAIYTLIKFKYFVK